MRRSPIAAAIVLGAVALLGLTACPMPPSNAARMQQAAIDLNTNVRFGRMELAIEQVAPLERDDFMSHRRGWGSKVHLADYEMVGARMVDDDHAEVSVKYAWYRPDQGDLRQTVVRQKWTTLKGSWLLAGEARVDGDLGLFGEPAPEARAAPRENVQFPTVRLGED